MLNKKTKPSYPCRFALSPQQEEERSQAIADSVIVCESFISSPDIMNILLSQYIDEEQVENVFMKEEVDPFYLEYQLDIHEPIDEQFKQRILSKYDISEQKFDKIADLTHCNLQAIEKIVKVVAHERNQSQQPE